MAFTDAIASPIPFRKNQLPYSPLFDPSASADLGIAPNGTVYNGGEMSQPGGYTGQTMGMHQALSHGPASVAASAIIGPTPGGVAGTLVLIL